MRSILLTTLSLLPTALAATVAKTSITFTIPPSHLLPNPYHLPPTTHATLSTHGVALSAPLSQTNSFVFHNLTAGSYLLDVHAATHAFAPARVDVLLASDDKLSAAAWETYRGNDWNNKGEALPRSAVGGEAFDVRPMGEKGYYSERSSFSPLGLLKNPMILMGLVSMGLFIGMPKLMENMDPEMRAEFEEQQKSNPVSNLLRGGGGSQASPMGNFDMAAYLAGSQKKEDGNGAGSSNGGGGGKKSQGVRR